MKKNLLLIAITAILFSTFFTSCDKDSLNLASMSATVNDTDWKASVRLTVLDSANFLITGTSLSGDVIALTVFGSTEGTYTLSLDSISADFEGVYTNGVSLNDVYTATNGEVVLSKVNTTDEKISGTFSFSAMNPEGTTIEVKDGTFENLKYTLPQQ